MAIAYVLVICDLGSEEQIIEELKHLSDVKEVYGTFGAYDILVKLESANEKNLSDIITEKIRKLSRVSSTLTLMILEGQ